jgi:DNA-binding PadR family transcriptional regulator
MSASTEASQEHPMFDLDPRHAARRRQRHHDHEWGPWSHASMRADLREMVDTLRSSRRAVRRGNVRPLILKALTREPMHGYQVIQELEAESGGRWRPSAGSVYPTLQQLEDEGLVRSADVDGRRVYSLTDAGRKAAAEQPDLGPERFGRDAFGPGADPDAPDIRKLAIQLAGAVMQVAKMGTPAAQREARDVLLQARRRMYRILAEDGDFNGHEDGDAPAEATTDEGAGA